MEAGVLISQEAIRSGVATCEEKCFDEESIKSKMYSAVYTNLLEQMGTAK